LLSFRKRPHLGLNRRVEVDCVLLDPPQFLPRESLALLLEELAQRLGIVVEFVLLLPPEALAYLVEKIKERIVGGEVVRDPAVPILKLLGVLPEYRVRGMRISLS
jgi:hypothetical protein